jgi:DNA-directed RNA polymerase specialized sigma24 family protein
VGPSADRPRTAAGTELKRYGYLLCRDRGEAEDLVQDALVRTFTFSLRSDVIQVEQCVHKVMLNLFLDQARHGVWQRLVPLWRPPPIRTPTNTQTCVRRPFSCRAVLLPRPADIGHQRTARDQRRQREAASP